MNAIYGRDKYNKTNTFDEKVIVLLNIRSWKTFVIHRSIIVARLSRPAHSTATTAGIGLSRADSCVSTTDVIRHAFLKGPVRRRWILTWNRLGQ